jgi:hypothetical protein
MVIALDYTTRIDPSALRAAGASDVLRYLKPDRVPAYRITLTEYRELLAAGIGVTLNWEYDAHDWLTSNGAAHGAEAVRQALALGYPRGCTIIGSADFDMTRTSWVNMGRAYALGFASAVRSGGYRPGVYGPWDVLTWVHDEVIMDRFWQAGMSTAWSGGRNAARWPGAHLRQRGHKTVDEQDTDWNEILIPAWGQAREGIVELTDKVNRTESNDYNERRDIDQVLGDSETFRNIWFGTVTAGDSQGRFPGPSSPLVRVFGVPAQVNALNSKVDVLTTKVDQIQAGQVTPAALVAALQDPAVIAVLVEAARQGANKAEDS